MFPEVKSIHFVGIGGPGVSALADLALVCGCSVTGSDIAESDVTQRLAARGASVTTGRHRVENLPPAELVVYSRAAGVGNPEIGAARDRGIKCRSRGEFVAELVNGTRGVAVAGTHGKTSTAAMLAAVLVDCGLDPTVILGGIACQLGGGARLGDSGLVIAEADESDGSHLLMNPTHTILTCVDSDHLEYYGSMEKLQASFALFVKQVADTVVFCGDDPRLQAIMAARSHGEGVSYGLGESADIRARALEMGPGGSRFSVYERGTGLGQVELSIPGEHNVLNALAAVGMALKLGVDFDCCSEALTGYRGVRRRFERKGECSGITVVDDYAHHPSEIIHTVAAARLLEPERVIVVFQPHRYSRTQSIAHEFAHCFD